MKNNRDERIRTNADETRSSRTMSENLEAGDLASPLETQRDLDRPFRDEFNMEALPNPNEGGNKEYHYFWSTTTNPLDTPHRRMRMGYELVRSEERPEFKHLRLKSGDYEGCIAVNEMLLMRIPMTIYQQLMMENHHHRPNDREASLKANAQLGHVDKNGRPIDVRAQEDEGYRELGKTRRAPTRFE